MFALKVMHSSDLKRVFVHGTELKYIPSVRVNKPTSLPFPSLGRQKQLLFELDLSSNI